MNVCVVSWKFKWRKDSWRLLIVGSNGRCVNWIFGCLWLITWFMNKHGFVLCLLAFHSLIQTLSFCASFWKVVSQLFYSNTFREKRWVAWKYNFIFALLNLFGVIFQIISCCQQLLLPKQALISWMGLFLFTWHYFKWNKCSIFIFCLAIFNNWKLVISLIILTHLTLEKFLRRNMWKKLVSN